jgi:ribosomal protein L21E
MSKNKVGDRVTIRVKGETHPKYDGMVGKITKIVGEVPPCMWEVTFDDGRSILIRGTELEVTNE